MDAELKSFVEEILGVNPQYKNLNVFAPGSNLPGMGGQSIITTGASNAGTDTIHHLQLATAEFAQRYRQNEVTPEQLKEPAQKVEGLLMMSQTIEALSEQKTNHLIDALHTLMEAKYGA
jgi:hypothetical protein